MAAAISFQIDIMYPVDFSFRFPYYDKNDDGARFNCWLKTIKNRYIARQHINKRKNHPETTGTKGN